MRNAGQPGTRDMIAEVVWGSSYNDFTNLIEVFVKRLRQKTQRRFRRFVSHYRAGRWLRDTICR
jgi:DNA-binding response OmpR family regulator